MTNPDDYPFWDVVRDAEEIVFSGRGLLFQKWTCAKCGERVTMNSPNFLHKEGRHEDCPVDPDFLTNIEEQGCNFMLISSETAEGRRLIKEAVESWERDGEI